MAKALCPRKNNTQYSQMLPSKVGGTFKSSKNRGSMDLGGKGRYIHVHKYAGIKSDFSCFASFSSRTKTAAVVTYINKLGGTHSYRLTSLALEMWNFAADRNLTLSAVYVPREENHTADKKSRVFQDSLEWMLHPAVFQALQKEVDWFNIDLFATRVNHQFLYLSVGDQSLGQLPQMFSM